jgi:DNA repair exonuclease SbcCD ATPase subunit
MNDQQLYVIDGSKKIVGDHSLHPPPEYIKQSIVQGYNNKYDNLTTTQYVIIKKKINDHSELKEIKKNLFELKQILNELLKPFKEISSTKEGGDYMLDNKELFEKISNIEKKVYELDSSLARIEERTKKLDNIESVLNDLRKDIPRGDSIATKDYVNSKINEVRLWLILTMIGIGVSLIKLFIM